MTSDMKSWPSSHTDEHSNREYQAADYGRDAEVCCVGFDDEGYDGGNNRHKFKYCIYVDHDKQLGHDDD